jgi:hypothetical protein
MLLMVLAAAQVGAAIWLGGAVLGEIRGAHPNLVLISAIGTGIYMAGLGSACTLIGAILAWTGRSPGGRSTRATADTPASEW